MKAITVCQPWAWAIAQGYKRVDNRTWQTRYRGPILIHAGRERTKYAGVWQHLRSAEFAAAAKRPRDKALASVPWPTPEEVPYGAIVAVAKLIECVHWNTVLALPIQYQALRCHPFAAGPWCWLLGDIEAIEPMPARGQRGLWEWPGEWFDPVPAKGGKQ